MTSISSREDGERYLPYPDERGADRHKYFVKPTPECYACRIRRYVNQFWLHALAENVDFVKDDYHLVYSLEIRIINLEKQLEALEARINTLSAELKINDAEQPDHGIPSQFVARIEAGENAVKVLRMHRMMTQRELGEISGIRANHISAIERGMPYGLKTARRLADALNVSVDLLT